MTYHDSTQSIKVGDKVTHGGRRGIIVFVIDDDSYTDRYPRENWSYLGKGFGVELEEGEWRGTLIHSDSPDEDLEFVG